MYIFYLPYRYVGCITGMAFLVQLQTRFIPILTNRYFNICINNHVSSSARLLCGVPQGSGLGPIWKYPDEKHFLPYFSCAETVG